MLNTLHRITEKRRLFSALTSRYVKVNIEASHMAGSDKNTILTLFLYGLTIIKQGENKYHEYE